MPIDPTTGYDTRTRGDDLPRLPDSIRNPAYDQPHAPPGLGSRLGLAPIVAFGMVGADWLTFTGLELPSGFLLTFVSFIIACALFPACLLGQKYIYGDGWGAAASKAGICTILTAIPSALPSFLVAALGVAGAIEMKRRRSIDATGREVN